MATSNLNKKNVYIFTDKNGNITQIKKQDNQRRKYYIDPELPPDILPESCYIGISNTDSVDCSYGIALGFGDTTILLAKY